MRFLPLPHRESGPRRIAAASAAAAFAALLLTSAQTSPTQQAPTKPPTTAPTATGQQPSITTRENLDAMGQSHGEFRRAVLAEFQKVATKRNQQMDVGSLIITSCNEHSLLAGVSVTPKSGGDVLKNDVQPGEVRPDVRPIDPKDPKNDGRPDSGAPPTPQDHPGDRGRDTGIDGRVVQPVNDRQPLGLVVIAGSFLRVHSREPNATPPNATPDVSAQPGERHPLPGEREVASLGFTNLEPGFYGVRRGMRANTLELVNFEDRVALTIPFRPGANRPVEAGARDFGKASGTGEHDTTGRDRDGEGDGLSGKTAPHSFERDDPLARTDEWPEIYLEILHALDLADVR